MKRANLEAPGPADLPRAARVANVGALERNLQHEMAVAGLVQVQRVAVQVVLKKAKKKNKYKIIKQIKPGAVSSLPSVDKDGPPQKKKNGTEQTK